MTFSEQIVYAMFKPSKYKELIHLKSGRNVLFIAVLMMVLGIVTFVIPLGAFITGFGGFEKMFDRRLASIEFQDGALSLDNTFSLSVDYYNILIDTASDEVSDEQIRKDGVYFALGARSMRMLYSLDGKIAEYRTVQLDRLLPEGFNHDMLIRMIPAIYVYLFMVFLMSCVGYFIKYGFIALVFSIMIHSMNKRLELKLSYGQVFMLCFYGQTLGIILSNFNAALGFLPAALVSIIGIFISIHMITAAMVFMNPRAQV